MDKAVLMYNVFSTSSTSDSLRRDVSDQEHGPPTKKRREEYETKKLTRSCAECRRRRIRCDSTDPPCGQCQWYKVPHLCHYPTRRKRTVPSQESFATISTALEKSDQILKTLFPTESLDDFSGLSRKELLAFISSSTSHESETSSTAENDDALQCLEPSPEQEFQWDESTRNQDPSQKISDDVNALSLSLDSSSSYLGISSISAILRVMAYISPEFRISTQRHQARATEARSLNHAGLQTDELTLVNAYFAHIHCITPIVDEADFRAKFARRDDQQSPWLALFNMVLTIGSLATSEPDEKTHSIFYARAYQHLGLESFGTGHLETVQALGLLGGCYCHYLNQPNMANVIMGAALRMAIAMGLHREPVCKEKERLGSGGPTLLETKRRVWWSLFCLDSWPSFTLGRPSLGRWDPGTITAKLPKGLSNSDFASVSLRASVEFCKIGTEVQDRFARQPVISCREILDFDNRLLKWHKDLPPVMKRSSSCPQGLRAARGLMLARYQNLRLVVTRPRLLITTLRQIPPEDLSSDERKIVEKCRVIASEIIGDVQKDLFPIQQIVRNSVWFLFQGCLVPLLSLFSDSNHKDAEKWHKDVETTLALLKEMSNWSLVVERTWEVVSTIYEAAQHPTPPQSVMPMDLGPDFSWDSWYTDPFWDETEWASIPGFNGFDFDITEFSTIDSHETSG